MNRLRTTTDMNREGSIGSNDSDVFQEPLLEQQEREQPWPPSPFTVFRWCCIIATALVSAMNSATAAVDSVYGKNFSVEEAEQYMPYLVSNRGILLMALPISAFLANIASGMLFTEGAIKRAKNIGLTAFGILPQSLATDVDPERIPDCPMGQGLSIIALILGLLTIFTYTALGMGSFDFLIHLSANQSYLSLSYILYALLIIGNDFTSSSSRISGGAWFLEGLIRVSYSRIDKILDHFPPEYFPVLRKKTQHFDNTRKILILRSDMKAGYPFLNADQRRELFEHMDRQRFPEAIVFFRQHAPEQSKVWSICLLATRGISLIIAGFAAPLFYSIGYQLNSIISNQLAATFIAAASSPLHVLLFLVMLPRAIRSIPIFYQWIKITAIENQHSYPELYATTLVSLAVLVSVASYGSLAYSGHNHAQAGDFDYIYPDKDALDILFSSVGGACCVIVNLYCLLFAAYKIATHNTTLPSHSDKTKIDDFFDQIEHLAKHAASNSEYYQNGPGSDLFAQCLQAIDSINSESSDLQTSPQGSRISVLV